MLEYLTPTTLAAIVADLIESEADLGDTDQDACVAAYRQGVALVGKNDFDLMVDGNYPQAKPERTLLL
jgi:hypothetical protein